VIASDGEVLDVEKIVDNGSGASRWDLVIMGDGYRSDEIAKYEHDVAGVVDAILKTVPFDRLRPAINVHRVNVASAESGAGDLCTGTARATFFHSNFCAGGLDRLLVTDTLTAIDVATEAVPQMNSTLMIVNSDVYGGSGGAVPVFSLAEGAFEIALHEMGHSHFGLADEYPYLSECGEEGHAQYDGPEPVEPNVARSLHPLKWAKQVTKGVGLPTTTNADCSDCDPQPNPLDAGAIGAFDGARYFRCGLYRPQFDCRMRGLGVPFCGVCQATIARVLEPFTPARQGRRRAVGRR
jgi:hypothetical protein